MCALSRFKISLRFWCTRFGWLAGRPAYHQKGLELACRKYTNDKASWRGAPKTQTDATNRDLSESSTTRPRMSHSHTRNPAATIQLQIIWHKQEENILWKKRTKRRIDTPLPKLQRTLMEFSYYSYNMKTSNF